MCNCKNRTKRDVYTVTLAGGLKVEKNGEAAAKAFAAKHPGATVSKKS